MKSLQIIYTLFTLFFFISFCSSQTTNEKWKLKEIHLEEDNFSGFKEFLSDNDTLWIPFLYMVPTPLSYLGFVASSYYVRVYLGTPPQALSAIMDGGLDLFTVYGENCTEYPCQKYPFYNTLSYSYAPNGTALNYTYAAGAINIQGEISTDISSIAGMSLNSFNFGLIDEIFEPAYFPNVSSTAINAVFGFAYPTEEWGALSLVNQYNSFNEYLSEVIAIWMPDSIYERGQLALGGADPSRYTGQINYVPLLPSTWAQKNYNFFWSNIVDDILVNGVSTGVCTKKTCNFFLDLAGKPMDLASAVPSITVNPSCDNIADLPTITIIINKIEYIIPPEDYVMKYVTSTKTVQCESGISSGGHVLYPFTFGYTWMRNFYTILDYENQRIGFANGA